MTDDNHALELIRWWRQMRIFSLAQRWDLDQKKPIELSLERYKVAVFSTSKIFATVVATLLWFSPAAAQQSPADTCFAAKDKACLEAVFEDILSNPSPKKTRAIYLLGRLEQDNGNFEEAKDTFMMAIGFGGSVDARKALTELFGTNPAAFNEPTDCLAMQSEACFMAIIENGQGNAVRNAQYLFGKGLMVSDPVRAATLLEASDTAGHGTSKCLLQDLYRDGAEGLPADYHKSVTFGIACQVNHPFRAFTPDHFAEYQALPGFKAYAYDDSGVANHSTGITDPDVAARLALEFCNASSYHQTDNPNCRVINLDGIWVEEPIVPELPEFSGTFEGLVTVEAQESFTNQYSSENTTKVFVQSQNGSWTWRSKRQSDATLETMTKEALDQCNTSWRAVLDYPCEVINMDGEWMK